MAEKVCELVKKANQGYHEIATKALSVSAWGDTGIATSLFKKYAQIVFTFVGAGYSYSTAVPASLFDSGAFQQGSPLILAFTAGLGTPTFLLCKTNNNVYVYNQTAAGTLYVSGIY